MRYVFRTKLRLAKIYIYMPICAWNTDWEPVKSFAHTYGTHGKSVDYLPSGELT